MIKKKKREKKKRFKYFEKYNVKEYCEKGKF